jgi:hypothetical protein
LDYRGQPTTIDYGNDHRGTLVLVFSPLCGWCAKNWPAWKDAIARIDTKRVNVVAVDLLGTLPPDCVARFKIDALRIVYMPDPATTKQYRLGTTPQTILIGADARVRRVWSGPLTSEQRRELGESIESM